MSPISTRSANGRIDWKSRLRRRVNTLQAFTVPVPRDAAGPVVDAALLTTLSAACRDREQLRLEYTDHAGTATRRTVEPYRLVNWGRRWYLLAFDVDRQDWRTLRVDRLTPRIPNGPRFTPRPLPSGDVAAYVSSRVSVAAWRYRAAVSVHAPATDVAERITPAVGVVEAVDGDRCVLHTGADSVETLAVYLGLLDADFTVDGPPELLAHLARLATRYGAAAARLTGHGQ